MSLSDDNIIGLFSVLTEDICHVAEVVSELKNDEALMASTSAAMNSTAWNVSLDKDNDIECYVLRFLEDGSPGKQYLSSHVPAYRSKRYASTVEYAIEQHFEGHAKVRVQSVTGEIHNMIPFAFVPAVVSWVKDLPPAHEIDGVLVLNGQRKLNARRLADGEMHVYIDTQEERYEWVSLYAHAARLGCPIEALESHLLMVEKDTGHDIGLAVISGPNKERRLIVPKDIWNLCSEMQPSQFRTVNN